MNLNSKIPAAQHRKAKSKIQSGQRKPKPGQKTWEGHLRGRASRKALLPKAHACTRERCAAKGPRCQSTIQTILLLAAQAAECRAARIVPHAKASRLKGRDARRSPKRFFCWLRKLLSGELQGLHYHQNRVGRSENFEQR
jgi:hypothetical protein